VQTIKHNVVYRLVNIEVSSIGDNLSPILLKYGLSYRQYFWKQLSIRYRRYFWAIHIAVPIHFDGRPRWRGNQKHCISISRLERLWSAPSMSGSHCTEACITWQGQLYSSDWHVMLSKRPSASLWKLATRALCSHGVASGVKQMGVQTLRPMLLFSGFRHFIP